MGVVLGDGVTMDGVTDATLAAVTSIASLTGAGMLAQTVAGTYAVRSIASGNTAQLTISNATASGGNPAIVPGVTSRHVLAYISGGNLNSTTAQAFTSLSPFTKFLPPNSIWTTNVSTTLALSLAAGTVRTASGGGTNLATLLLTGLTGSAVAVAQTLAVTAAVVTTSQVWLSITTAHGTAATLDCYLVADAIG